MPKRKWTTVDFTLIVVCAALYAGALIAFSAIKLGAGISLRPANALQPVFGILFGVPGAIGIALGNLVNDIYTGFFSKSLAGVVGNFLGAYIPYLIISNPRLRTSKSIAQYVIGVVGLTSAVVAGSVLLNVALGLTAWPLAQNVLIPLIFGQQVVATAILGPILLNLLYPFVKRAGLYRGRAVDETREQEAA